MRLLEPQASSPDPGADATASAQASLHHLPGDVLVVDAPTRGGAPWSGEMQVDGVALAAPRCTIHTGTRRVLVTRLARDGGVITLGHGDSWIDAPSPADSAAFLGSWAASAAADQATLLRFLAVTALPILRLGKNADFAALLLRLADLSAPPTQLRPLTREGAPAISIWQVPDLAGEGAWYVLSPRGARRIAAPIGGVLMLDSVARGQFLLPPPHPDGTARAPFRFAPAPASLPGPLESRPGDVRQDRALARALSRRIAARPEDPLAVRLLRDRRLLARPAEARRLDDPARPIGAALELAVSDAGGGVFLRGWLRDPLRMASGGLALRDVMTSATLPVPREVLHHVARPDLVAHFAAATHGGAGARPGFVAHLPDAERRTGGPVAQWGLDIVLASGEAIQVTAPPGLLPPTSARALVLRAVAPEALDAGVLDNCLTPAVARLQRAALAALDAPEIIQIGARPKRPHTALVIPLYRNLHFLRFQVAAFARDVALRVETQIVLVLDSPEQREAVEHLLRGLHAVHAIPLTLVVMAANAGYASASNAGAAAAAECVAHILLLNSDVVPTRPGWLAAMLQPLRRDPGVFAVGPKLLFEDGSVQHAGLFFQRHGAAGDWLNGHYGKGMPRQHPGVRRPRSVPGVTGAALLVRRDRFEEVGGVCTDYVVGDYEDSDLCLRLRAIGGDVRYAPTAELYHFERQSIVAHGGYAQTLACAHNRRLHHLRWDTAIDDLMGRFGACRMAAA